MPQPLQLQSLHKRFGERPVVAEFSLTVEPGELVALVGPNGSGKSTVLGCVIGAVIPDAGHVVIAGHDLHRAPLAARAALRALPQEVDVPEGLTGRELLAFHADVFADPKPTPDRAQALAHAADSTGLGATLDTLATTYSVGMRKRLCFACLLFGRASLYVLDEPFAGVDPAGREAMVTAIHAALATGAGVLLSAHDVDEFAPLGLSPRVFTMGAGPPSTH